MIIVELIHNLAVLVALSVISGFISLRYDSSSLRGKILQGVLFGTAAVIGMIYPFHLSPGIIFDGRSVVISICTLFFGPLPGFISAAASVIYRNYLGGQGAIMGTLVITSSFLTGYLFYYRRQKGMFHLNKSGIYAFGFLVSALMILFVLMLPSHKIAETYKTITFTVMLGYPLITLLMGKILLDQEENRNYLDRINAEKKLYRTTLYSIGDAVISTDRLGNVISVNPVAEKLTGWKEADAVNQPVESVFRIISEFNGEPVVNPVKRVLEEGLIIGLANHTLLVTRDGTLLPIVDSAAPIRDDNNNITGMVLVFRDQTEERNYQKNIQDNNNRLHRAELASKSGNWEFHLDKGTVITSEGARAVYGLEEKEEWRIEEIRKIPLPEFRPMLDRAMNELIEKNIPYNVEFRIEQPRTGRPADIYSIAYYDRENRIIFGVIQDITERKKAEADLRESEEKFRHLFENHSAVKLIIDHNTGRIIDANLAAGKYYGWSIDRLKRMNIAEINTMPPEEIRKEMTKARDLNKTCFQFRHRLADGTERDVEVFSSRITIGENEFLHSIIHDITDQKIAQKAVELNMERLDRLLKLYQYAHQDTKDLLEHTLSEALKLTSSRIGFIYFYNEETEQFTLNTYSKDVMKECAVKEFREGISLKDTGLWGEAVRQRKEIIINDFSTAHPPHKGCPEGHVKLKSFMSIPIFDNGQIVAVTGVGNKDSNYDQSDVNQLRLMMNSIWRIVKRKEAEDKLVSLSRAIEQSPVLVVITGIDGSIQYVNPEFSKVTGYEPDEVIGKNPRILKSGHQSQEFYKDLWDTVLKGHNWSGILKNRKKNGRMFWESDIITPIKDENGRIVNFVAVKEDITEKVEKENELKKYRERLEELVIERTNELNKLNKKLINQLKKERKLEERLQESLLKEREINELKTRFIATVSHEFRTPLSALLTSAEMIERYSSKWSEEKLNLHYRRINSTISYLTQLLDDVLTISRADREILKNNPERINITETLSSYLDDLKNQITEMHRVKMVTRLSGEVIFIDRKLLRHIFLNLITNAVKYSPEGGVITVELGLENEIFTMKITDQGIGIPDNEIKYIFDAFYRTGNSVGIPGSGLGLNIVKRSLDIMHGEISVESRLNTGTAFTVSIPVNQK